MSFRPVVPSAGPPPNAADESESGTWQYLFEVGRFPHLSQLRAINLNRVVVAAHVQPRLSFTKGEAMGKSSKGAGNLGAMLRVLGPLNGIQDDPVRSRQL